MKIIIDFKDEIWQRLQNGESLLMRVTYVKERGEVFLMEETRGKPK